MRDPLPDLSARISADGTIAVRVTPKASRERIVVEADSVRVYVTVAPEDGKANAAVIRLLAKALGAPKTSLCVIRGETSRDKVVRLANPKIRAAD